MPINRFGLAVFSVLMLAGIWTTNIWSTEATAQECLRISDLSASSKSNSVITENLYAALTRANICVDRIALPARRSSSMLEHGEVDGESARVFSYLTRVEDFAIRVEEPMTEYNGYLITRDETVDGMGSLGGILVGVLRGVHWSDKIAQEAPEIYYADSSEQLIEMFDRERVGAILLGGSSATSSESLKGLNWIPVFRTTTHVYLHKSMSHWSERISQAIRNYKRDGFTFSEDRSTAGTDAES